MHAVQMHRPQKAGATPEMCSPHLFRKVTNSGKSKKPLLSHVSFCRVGHGRGKRCECGRGMTVIETERQRDRETEGRKDIERKEESGRG